MTTAEPAAPVITAAPAPSPAPVEPVEPEAETLDQAELEVLRDLLVQACPDAIPDLIQGDDAAALLASIPAARAAFAHVAATITAPPPPTPIPASNPTRSFHPDPATLSPLAKIRHGLTRE